MVVASRAPIPPRARNHGPARTAAREANCHDGPARRPRPRIGSPGKPHAARLCQRNRVAPRCGFRRRRHRGLVPPLGRNPIRPRARSAAVDQLETDLAALGRKSTAQSPADAFQNRISMVHSRKNRRDPPMGKEILTIADASALLSLSEAEIERLLLAGELPGRHIGPTGFSPASAFSNSSKTMRNRRPRLARAAAAPERILSPGWRCRLRRTVRPGNRRMRRLRHSARHAPDRLPPSTRRRSARSARAAKSTRTSRHILLQSRLPFSRRAPLESEIVSAPVNSSRD